MYKQHNECNQCKQCKQLKSISNEINVNKVNNVKSIIKLDGTVIVKQVKVGECKSYNDNVENNTPSTHFLRSSQQSQCFEKEYRKICQQKCLRFFPIILLILNELKKQCNFRQKCFINDLNPVKDFLLQMNGQAGWVVARGVNGAA